VSSKAAAGKELKGEWSWARLLLVLRIGEVVARVKQQTAAM
jgi:hypothetical protein